MRKEDKYEIRTGMREKSRKEKQDIAKRVVKKKIFAIADFSMKIYLKVNVYGISHCPQYVSPSTFV